VHTPNIEISRICAKLTHRAMADLSLARKSVTYHSFVLNYYSQSG